MRFCGRKEGISALSSFWKTVRRQNVSQMVSVIGRRRVGKTTLVLKAFENEAVPFLYLFVSQRVSESDLVQAWLSKQLSAKAESFYLSSLQSNSTLGRFTTALGLSADSPIPAGSDLHSSRCAHGDHSADKQNDASTVCPIANTPNTSVRYTEDPHTLR